MEVIFGPDIETTGPITQTGDTYNIMIKGLGLTEGMEFRLGQGVVIKETAFATGGTEAKTKVEVAQNAQAGERKAEFWLAANQPWVTSDASARVSMPGAKPITEAAVPNPDLQNFYKGVIKLKEPENYSAPGSYGFAMNDRMLFRWQELNPGVAEWFEFRGSSRNRGRSF
jgi:hypothetical protein